MGGHFRPWPSLAENAENSSVLISLSLPEKPSLCEAERSALPQLSEPAIEDGAVMLDPGLNRSGKYPHWGAPCRERSWPKPVRVSSR
jgi:hypothetical protein